MHFFSYFSVFLLFYKDGVSDVFGSIKRCKVTINDSVRCSAMILCGAENVTYLSDFRESFKEKTNTKQLI